MSRRRHRILGKSPSFMAMNRTRLRALANGGVTQDFSANVENIREISRKLGYNILKTPINRNLLQFPEDFTNVAWNTTQATATLNTSLNPFSITKSYYLTDNNVSATHAITQFVSTISGTTYTASFYVKKADDDWCQFRMGTIAFGTDTWKNLNLNTGEFSNGGGSGVWSVSALDNGYWKVTVITTAIATGLNSSATIVGTNNLDVGIISPSYIGANRKFCNVAGIQLELGLVSTPFSLYAPNNTNADFLYVPSSYGEGKSFAQVHNKRNLLQWSEDFSNALYGKQGTTISVNAIIAPDGTLTTDKLVETSLNEAHSVYQRNPTVVGDVRTGSVYLLKFTDVLTQTRYAVVGLRTQTNDRTWWVVNVDLQTGLVTDSLMSDFNSTPITGYSYNVVDVGSYWRIVVTGTIPFTGTQTNLFIACSNSSTPIYNNFAQVLYTGNVNKGLFIWGAQLEQGAYATPYQKTVASGDGIVDFNFTRATSARVTNKQGVIEDSCYNLLQQSESFNTAPWVLLRGTITPNITTSPINSLTADKYIKGVGNFPWYLSQDITFSTGNYYSFSVHVKNAGESTANIGTTSEVSGNLVVSVNLTTGVVSTPANNANWTNTSSSSILVNDGWYLVSVIGLRVGATASVKLSIGTNFGNSSGNAVDGIYIWGAQLVQGSTPRPYLRTTNRLNVPRLDYSRGTGEPELLIERASANTIIQSEDFTTSRWFGNSTTVLLNTSLNPFNTNKSYYVKEDNTNNTHRLFYNPQGAYVIGETHTFSWYVKKAQDSWICLSPGLNAFGSTYWTNFNFDAGTFGNNGGGGIWTKKQLVNGYWLITATANAITTALDNSAQIGGTNNTDSATSFPAYTGSTGHNIVDIAVVQKELGSTATTYIPTTTATVTRATELNYVDLWNNSLLNSTNWTLFWEGYLYDGSGTGMSFCLSNTNTAATNTSQIGWFDSIQPFYNIANTRTSSGITVSQNTFNRFAIQYNNGVADFYVNGVNVWPSRTVAVFDYRYLVCNSGGSTFTTNKITLFNRTLTSTECITLTT